MAFRLRVLGPVTVASEDDPPAVSRVTQPRQLALLVYLALARPHGLQPREHIAELLWPGQSPERVRRGLRNALHGLRSVLGADVILSVGSSLIGLDRSRVLCDADDLELGQWRPSHTSPRDRQMAILDGLHVDGAADFDHWLSSERARLHDLVAKAEAMTAMSGSSDVSSAPVDRTRRHPVARHGDDAAALYLRGHYCFLRAAHDGDPTTLQHCRTYFERALAIDPACASAMAGLANYYAVAARRSLLVPFEKHFATCLEYSARALELDDTLAVPHVHFGVEAMYLTDQWVRAGEQFALASYKDPTYAEGFRFHAVWLGLDGRPAEAVAAAEEAARLEPDIVTMLGTLGAARAAAGDAAGAESAWRQALELDVRHAPARERLLRCLESAGRWDEAIVERRRGGAAYAAEDFQSALARDGAAGYRACRRAELQRMVAHLECRLIEQPTRDPLERFAPPVLRLVAALAELGEWSRARAWQLQATAQRPALARWFTAMPELRDAPARHAPARDPPARKSGATLNTGGVQT